MTATGLAGVLTGTKDIHVSEVCLGFCFRIGIADFLGSRFFRTVVGLGADFFAVLADYVSVDGDVRAGLIDLAVVLVLASQQSLVCGFLDKVLSGVVAFVPLVAGFTPAAMV